MKVLSAEEMRSIDHRTIEKLKVPGLILMENAGRGVFECIQMEYGRGKMGRAFIVCGKGNNGGDGFVVARHLLNHGWHVECFLLGDPSKLKGETLTNYIACTKSQIPVHIVRERKGLNPLRRRNLSINVVVDALLGTGLDSPVKGLYSYAIECINRWEGKVVSVDIPSGVNSSNGLILGKGVRATLTVTFALPKLGHVLHPGVDYCGKVRVVDIGIPPQSIEAEDVRCELIHPGIVKSCLPERLTDSHKGHYGHLLIVAGSKGKTGAAVLAGMGALRTGAGLVTVAVPESQQQIAASMEAELMTESLSETDEGTFHSRAAQELLTIARDKDGIALGPGITTHPETVQFIKEFLSNYSGKVILDADGINCLSILGERFFRGIKGRCLITPHPGEMARLLGIHTKEVQSDRIGYATGISNKYDFTVTLKGSRTIIANPEGRVYINPTGNPGMATAGMGDLLTGMIGGIMVQGIHMEDASRCAVYLHGMAGDRAAEKYGEEGLLTRDVLNEIPLCLKELLHGDLGKVESRE